MCYYCCYLTHINSSLSSKTHDTNQRFIPQHYQSQHSRSCNLTLSICLISLTLFFIMLNISLVLAHTSRIQQQQQREPSSNKILQDSSRGKILLNHIRQY